MNYITGMVAEIVLWADDLPPMVKFYRDGLGFEQVSPLEQASPVYLKACDVLEGVPQMVVLHQKPDAPTAPPQVYPRQQLTFTLQNSMIWRQRAEFKARGIVVRNSAAHPVFVAQTFIVDDPMGNEVKFFCLTAPLVTEEHEDGTITTTAMKVNPPNP